MRWLVRSMIFWAISLPLFYIFVLPWLMTKLNVKAQAETYVQCQSQLVAQNMAGTPTALLKPPQADHYCHCISDRVALERADLPALVRRQQPARLKEAMDHIVNSCNVELQQSLSQTIDTLPPPRVVKGADGVDTVYFK